MTVPDRLPMVAADRTRFLQILMNYGSNAIKYNRAKGRVTFSVSVVAPERVRVTVSDTGFGISPDNHGKIFQPFQRAGQEMGPIEGTGIGLVITKRLAELMHGAVGFQSIVGTGSQFWVELPTDASAERPSAMLAVRTDAPMRRSEEGRRLVLYVEDNPANVTFMKDLVTSIESIDLVTTPTAEMGVEFARRRLPEVIIMDINLPGMSGVEALRVLRAWPETKNIPVIALTAAHLSETSKRASLPASITILQSRLKGVVPGAVEI